jgi:hypothetical protein
LRKTGGTGQRVELLYQLRSASYWSLSNQGIAENYKQLASVLIVSNATEIRSLSPHGLTKSEGIRNIVHMDANAIRPATVVSATCNTGVR